MIYFFGLPAHLVVALAIPGGLFWAYGKTEKVAIRVISGVTACILLLFISLAILYAIFSISIYQDTNFDGKRYVSIKYGASLTRSQHYLERRTGIWPFEVAFREASTYEEPIYLNVENGELVARALRAGTGAVLTRIHPE